MTQAAADFLLACRADGLSPATVRWYAGRLGPLVLWFGPAEISDVGALHMRNYVAELRSRGKRYVDAPQRPTIDDGLSPDTIRGHVRALRRFFKWSYEEYHLSVDANPMLRIRAPKRSVAIPKAIDTADLRRLLECADPRDKALLAFLADTGCRVGGALNLKPVDLNLNQGRAVVREKGDRERIVPFSHYTEQLLREWLTIRPTSATTVFCALSESQYARPLTLSGVHSAIRRLAKKAGVTGRCNPHSFRHGFAREWLRAGGDMATLATIMGHSDPATTLRSYAVFTIDEAIEKHRFYSPMRGYE